MSQRINSRDLHLAAVHDHDDDTGEDAGKKTARWAFSEFCQIMPATAYLSCELEINSVCHCTMS
jgi:hypothetical protein